MKRRLRVGVVFGGRSGEHEISLRSALTVISAMDPKRYEIVALGITRAGKWYLHEDAQKLLHAAAPKLKALGRGGAPVNLAPAFERKLMPMASTNGDARAAGEPRTLPGPFDVIFPVLHGAYGEDGTMQGLLELAGIPYIGAGVLGSAIGMDKDTQKRLLRDAGLPVVRFYALTRSQYEDEPGLAGRRASELGYPIFVKPNALGSSIGISKVESARKLKGALDDAFRYDRKVLLEASCAGREFECAVLGNDHPEASAPGEVIVKGRHAFYDYASKYTDPDGSETRIPADVPPAFADRIRALSLTAFACLSLRGMARIDFLANAALDQLYINEVNTIPGFTAISMYPKMWEASGLPLAKLIDRLIELALEEHRARGQLQHSYLPEVKQ